MISYAFLPMYRLKFGGGVIWIGITDSLQNVPLDVCCFRPFVPKITTTLIRSLETQGIYEMASDGADGLSLMI